MSTTDPHRPDVEPTEPPSAEPIPAPTHADDSPAPITRASAAWVAIAVALVLLVLLIVFILQNQTRDEIKFLGFDGTVPAGIAMLIAAVAGGCLVAVAGIARMVQLRRIVRRTNSAEPEHSHRT
ncbi:MAG: LapA family protein [Marmoricola sp.]|nr:LapA family protein [Marmoricola sp.]